MLALDLFNTKYEQDLQEGAVDDLEARRIDTLNDRMQDLLARAKEPAYQANPQALAALKKQFQQVKDERDSYYKVREAGIPGNVPVEKIPGKEDLLKGKGRTYYEDEVNEDDVEDFIKAGGKIQYGKSQKGPRRPGMSLASRHIGGGKDRMKPSRSGRAANTQGKPVVSVEDAEKKNSETSPLDQKLQRLKVQARRQFPRAHTDDEALILKLLDKETQDDQLNRQTDARQDAELRKNFALDREQEDEIEDLQTQISVKEHGGGIGPRQHWQDLMPEQLNPEDDDWYDDQDTETELRSGDYVRDTQDGESGEVFRMQGDPYERRVRILDRDGRGWYIEPSRLTRVDSQDPDVQRYFGKKRVRDMDEVAHEQINELDVDTLKSYADKRGAQVAAMKADNPNPTAGSKEWVQQAVPAQQVNLAKRKIARKERQAGVAEAIVASGPRKPLDDRAVRKLVWDTMKINADSGEQALQRALSVLAKKPQSRMVLDLQDKFQNLADRLAQGVAEGWSDAVVARRTGSPRTPYSVYIKGRRWKDFENEDLARAVMNKLKAKFKADGRDPETVTIAPTDYDQPIKEDNDSEAVERAILNRIMVAHTDLLMKFGPDKVMQAAEEVAYNVGDVDEIGTSDVSAYVAQVRQILGAVDETQVNEKWSAKYKSSINCSNPKGFSQKAHCAGKKK